MNIEVRQLTDKDSPHVEKISEWQFSFWDEKAGHSFEFTKMFMQRSLQTDKIPQTYIALINGQVVGYHQIGMCDLEAYPDIYPWLMNLYVDENYRGRGVCSALLKNIPAVAKKLGLKELYLYTEHVGLYEKFGWQFIQEVETFLPTAKPFERLYKIEFNV